MADPEDTDTLARLRQRVADLEAEFEAEVEQQRHRFHYHWERHKVRFDRQMLELHRTLRTGPLRFLREAGVLRVLAAPLVYVLIVPLALTDLFVSLFHAVCFPVYGIDRVRRADFIALDRHQLAYLNGIEKLNCVYCGYANGLIAYVREVASRSEEHWCPIRHARRVAKPHDRYYDFADFGDADGYRHRKGRDDDGRA